jgi:hypothetical protein
MDKKFILACIILMYISSVYFIFRSQYAMGGFQILMGLLLTYLYNNKK